MLTESFLLHFARLGGFFLLSPFLNWFKLPLFAKLILTVALSLVMTSFFLEKSPAYPLNLLFEMALGYLMGFILSLLFEAIALGGEVVGTVAGFSLTEVFDPESNTSSPLFSRFFTLFAATLFFALDLHHLVLKLLFETKKLSFDGNFFDSLLTALTHLFTQMVDFALFPLAIFFLFAILIAILTRVIPTFHYFSIGLPIQIILGLIVMALSLSSFPELLKSSFYKFEHLITFIFNN